MRRRGRGGGGTQLLGCREGPITVTIRGSLDDPSHQLVGDVSGGQINVAPGSTIGVQLSGPTPLGTIASATFEATAQPSPS
jgi:hypothetical protein